MMTPQAIGAAAAVVPAVITLTPRILGKVEKAWYRYGEKLQKRITAIKAAYSQHCSAEKDSTLSTLNLIKIEEKKDKQSEQYPIFFLMSEDEPWIPKLYYQGFVPNLDATKWVISETKEISTEIKNLIGYICQYQITRDQGISEESIAKKGSKTLDALISKVKGDSPFFYDPINLFCEEFKSWLVNLSNQDLSEITKNHIENRIKYLEEIYLNYKIFSQTNSEQPFLPILLKIKTILQDEFITEIDLFLSKKSAREFFRELRVEIKNLMNDLLQLLFYGFHDSREVPENFDLEQIKKSNPDLKVYQVALNNISGQLLQHLVQKSIYSGKASQDLALQQDLTLAKSTYDFLNEETGNPKFPLEIPGIHVFNWFEVEVLTENQKSKKIESGVLREFADKKIMRHYLLLHGYVEKMAVFYNICDLLHQISGDVGNLTLYGCAANYVKFALNGFDTLKIKILESINLLKNTADEFYAKLADNLSDLTGNREKWANTCFKNLTYAYRNFQKRVKSIDSKKDQIILLINKINHPMYSQEVKQRIALLRHFVKFFGETNTTSIEDLDNNNELFRKSLKGEEKEQENKTTKIAARYIGGMLEDKNPQKLSPEEAVKLYKEAYGLYDQAGKDQKSGQGSEVYAEKFSKASEMFAKVITTDKKNYNAYLYCALSFISRGFSSEALVYLEQATEYFPETENKDKYLQLIFYRAIAKQNTANFKGAKDDFSEVVAKADQQSDLYKVAEKKVQDVLEYLDKQTQYLKM